MSAPCGGTECWMDGGGTWWHSDLSKGTCSVRTVTALIKKDPPNTVPCLDPFEQTIKQLIGHIGESGNREGLKQTPARVAKAWKEWCFGYHVSLDDIFKSFEDGAASYNEMVLLKDAPFYSHCEHHLAPFFGTASIAYIPHGRVLGLSKLSRLLDAYSRRLQVQERLTCQIADALADHPILHPIGVGVMLKARHLCMESRGIKQQGHVTITSALRGVIFNKPEARAEFLNLAGNGK